MAKIVLRVFFIDKFQKIVFEQVCGIMLLKYALICEKININPSIQKWYRAHKTDFGIILLLLQHLASQCIHLLLQRVF